MEALRLLRDATMGGADVVLDDGELVFPGGQRLPRNAPTGLTSKGRGGEAYNLDSLWFLVKKRDLGMRAYHEQCSKENIQRVQIVDKSNVLDYLSGKQNKIPQIASAEKARPKEVAASEKVAPEADEKAQEIRKALAREKEQRTRDSILLLEGRSFKHFLDVLGRYLKKRDLERRNEAAKMDSQAANPRGDRYRVDNKRFYRETMGADFDSLGIDTSGTFKKGAKPNAPANNFVGGATNPAGAPTATAMPGSRTTDGALQRNEPPKKPRVSSRRLSPIIVVPGARDMSALVNLANLPTLLEARTFKPAQEIIREGKLPPTFQVKHKRVNPRTGQPVEYLLTSNIRALRDEDWERVTAIVCQGAEWQFKGFPPSLGRTPPQILAKMQGFYFHYAGDKVSGPVTGWRLKMLPVERTRRHEDGRLWNEFWRTLEDYIAVHKSHLRF
mmetsp:Transcript_9093/g.27355  ORF Transcript_9093/g.27355 Transcript_9093/m.27355 type:complete len:443 (-) Transcript_9093:813-2141(-)